MNKTLILARVLPKLGFLNLLRIARYRLGLKRQSYRLSYEAPHAHAPFFCDLETISDRATVPIVHNNFGWHELSLTSPFSWHDGPILHGCDQNRDQPWDVALSQLSPETDIKDIWEASRFYWVVSCAQKAREGDPKALASLDALLADWSLQNPAGCGVNWGCAQEASIRVIMLARAAMILETETLLSTGLSTLLTQHARRIDATLHYAIAQDNNHASSEAAALLIYGTWCQAAGQDTKLAKRCRRRGRYWLENRAMVLLQKDGSSNQHATNYHRVVLDTYIVCSLWCKRLGQPGFSNAASERLAKAAHWLRQMTEPTSGDAVNLGANDGSPGLIDLTGSRRDFRATVQSATALFANQTSYPKTTEAFQNAVHQMGIELPSENAPPCTSETFDSGGYHVLRNALCAAYLRYPRFRFRPAQADALHFDLWTGAENVLRDTGTYSYSVAAPSGCNYGTTSTHNTITFDAQEQMPVLGRFLYGDWLKATNVQPVQAHLSSTGESHVSAQAGYKTRTGISHIRHVALGQHKIIIKDTIAGFKKTAVLRWHLNNDDWRLEGTTLTNGSIQIAVTADAHVAHCELTEGHQSLQYLQERPLKVLVATVTQPCTITTIINTT